MNKGIYNRHRFDINPLQGPNQTVKRIEVPRDMDGVIVSVKCGNVDLWFGEFSGDRPLVPHLHFGKINHPDWLPIPAGVYTITVRLENEFDDDDILACVILTGP